MKVENGPMYLRSYRDSDFERLYALDRACFAPRFRFSRAMMRTVVSGKGNVVLLACEAGENGAENTLGFCAAEVDANQAGQRFGYVSTLDVGPANRGRGVGKRLMLAVEEEVAQRGAEVMLLHVYTENQPAVRLYEGLRYAPVGRGSGFYGRGFDALVYRKELGRG